MVSFSFGKKRRSRDTNRPGYSKKNYLSSTGRFRHPSGPKRRALPAYVYGDLDFGRRRRRRRMPCIGRKVYFGKKRKTVRKGCGVHRKRGMCVTTNGCRWVKKSKKCVKRRPRVARVSKSYPMGDADDSMADYDAEAGITWMGRRRKSRKMMRRRKYRKSKKSLRRRKSRKTRKLPAKIRKMCKRFKIKCTKKVGSRRVYKKLSVVKRQIAHKMRIMRKRANRTRR